jgi:hypothetical protein
MLDSEHMLWVQKLALLHLAAASLPLDLGKSVTRPRESGKEDRRPHGQERTHRRNAHYRSDGEVYDGNQMRAEAIPDHEIENDHIE